MNSSTRNLEDVAASLKQFSIADYSVFIAMLVCCSCVGIYVAWDEHRRRKLTKNTEQGCETDNYLMGGRNMQVFPVAMSLIASHVSGIMLLGTGTEIYLYGTQYCFIFISICLSATFLHYIIIPVLHEIQVTSVYEYLERRFDVKVRLFGSIMYCVFSILKLPIIIYVPALAFNQTTGIDIHIITPITMCVCIFYTVIGGIKAVVWTDVIQIIIMYGVIVLIAIKGTASVGGLSVVIERNLESGRFEAPDFRIDPTIRHSFWTILLGGTVFWITITGLNQNMIQRYMALKDVKTARKGQYIFVFGVILMVLLCAYNGLLLFATYHNCDPLTTKLAKAKDQLTPLLAMDILKGMPGFPGLFIAGVFSAALSSLSTALNAMSGVVLEDFCKPFMKNGISDRTSAFIMRGTVILLGTISVALVYVVQHLGAVLQLSMSIPPACFAPLLGIYVIGFLIPWIGKRATLYGAIFGFLIVVYVASRAQADMAAGIIKYHAKPTSVEGCDYNFTMSACEAEECLIGTNAIPEKPFQFHHISYLYYLPLGALATIFSSFLLSFCLGFEDSTKLDSRLFAPFIRKYLDCHDVQKIAAREELTFKFNPVNEK